jgi:hypothetical protein
MFHISCSYAQQTFIIIYKVEWIHSQVYLSIFLQANHNSVLIPQSRSAVGQSINLLHAMKPFFQQLIVFELKKFPFFKGNWTMFTRPATESYPKSPSHSKALVTFLSGLGIYGERLLALHPTPKLNAYLHISRTQLLVQYMNSPSNFWCLSALQLQNKLPHSTFH